MEDDSGNISNVGKIFSYKKKLGLAIHLGVLGWLTLLSQIGVIPMDSTVHTGMIIFLAGQMIVFAGAIFTGLFRGGNPKVRCQDCGANMVPIKHKCPFCNSTFTSGDA